MLIPPVIAQSYATVRGDGAAVTDDLPSAALQSPDLLERFAGVSDRRRDQGRDHPVAVVLTLYAAAVLGGMRSFTAIAGWVADVPADLLAHLGSHAGFPPKSTLWRVPTGADAAAVGAAVGALASAPK